MRSSDTGALAEPSRRVPPTGTSRIPVAFAPRLMKILGAYNADNGKVFLETLAANTYFLTDRGRLFRKGERLRKNYKCTEVATKRVYVFNPIAEVYLPVASNK